MTSNINPTTINKNYPVAGQDNDSQGFRDNFNNILTNFTIAATEISALQANTVTTGGNTINNLFGATITNAVFNEISERFYDNGQAGAFAVSLDFSIAGVQKITTNAAATISNIVNWPSSGQYGEMVLIANISDPAHTLTLPTSITSGLSNLQGYQASTSSLAFQSAGEYHFKFSTVDGGGNVNIEDLNRATISTCLLYTSDAADE